MLSDLGAIHDPWAETMLDPAMARVLWGVRHLLPERVRRASVTLAGLAARVRWHDDQVVAALDDGIDQVVIVGAGYDSRAWRLARPGVRFFELDHPTTQDDKRARAPQGGPTYVPADLRTTGAGPALVGAGLDQGRQAIFVLEGLTMYLPEATVRAQLQELAGTAAPGSRLSTDFYPPQDQGTARNRRQNLLQHLARGGSGEDLCLTVGRDDARSLLASSGWTVTGAAGAREAATTLVPTSAGLPLDAVNDHKTLIAGRT